MNEKLESSLRNNNDVADRCGFPELRGNVAQLLRDIASGRGDDPRERAFAVCDYYDKANGTDAQMAKVFCLRKSHRQVAVAVTDRVPHYVVECLSGLSPLAAWVLVNEANARGAAATLTTAARIEAELAVVHRPAFMAAADGLETLLRAAKDEVDAALARLFASQHGDILGSYHYSGNGRLQIFLHWIPVWLFANRIGARYVDLLRVVLAHEYAHYYMHVGEDADVGGRRRRGHASPDGQAAFFSADLPTDTEHLAGWPESTYHQSSVFVHEGVAQYFTYRWCELHSDREENPWADGPMVAFRALLRHQSEPYVWWQEWQHGHAKPEAVRLAIRQARRQPAGVDRDQWLQLLASASRSAG